MSTINYHNMDYKDETCLSWNAILAGVSAGVVLGTLINLLGLGLGIEFLSFDMSEDVLKKIGFSSITWLAINGAIAMLGAGWITGWFSHTSSRINAALHSLLTWGLCALLTLLLAASTAGAFIGGTANLIWRAASLSTQGAGKIMELTPTLSETMQDSLPDLKPAINKVLQQAEEITNRIQTNSTQNSANISTHETTQDTLKELQNNITTLLKNDNDQDKSLARQKLSALLTEKTNMDQTEANNVIAQWEQSYNQAKTEITQKTEQVKEDAKIAIAKTKDIVSSMALLSFVILILSAIVAVIGGLLGRSAQESSIRNHAQCHRINNMP